MNRSDMESILVTGGTGFIGSHTCISLLENGKRVIIIDSLVNSKEKIIDNIALIINKLNNSKLEGQLVFYKGDIRDEEFLKNIFLDAIKKSIPIKSVIHFAGLKSIEESIINPLIYWDVNVRGSLILFKVMNHFECRTIVFSSSASIYEISNNEPLDEQSIINPRNPYSLTKATIEKILNNLYQSSKKEWRIANLRYFNPIGAHHSGLIGEIISDYSKNLFPYLCGVANGKFKKVKIFGDDWETHDGTPIRDFIHVMDVADAHSDTLNYLQKNKPQVINLNIGTGKGTSVLELIEIFKSVNNCNIPFEYVDKRMGDLPFVIANNKLAISLIKWRPKRDLKKMCRDGWQWAKLNE
tara:strand:+ start:415 stop:1476 length:1062 start_codon:yes stop_codon:yes gene_type:complete